MFTGGKIGAIITRDEILIRRGMKRKKSCRNLSKWEGVEEMKKEIAVQWKRGQLRREVWEKQKTAMA